MGGYILVGGKSSRFGQDKALLEIEGQPLAVRIAACMRPVVDSVTFVGPPAKYGCLGPPVIPDAVADFGPLGGLLAALEDSTHDWNLIAACDMPCVTTELFRSLVDRTAHCSEDIVLPYDGEGRPEPLCAAYRSTARMAVRQAVESGVHKVMKALDGLKVFRLMPADYATVDPAGLAFTNLNHPRDLEQAGLAARGKSHAGGVTRPGADCLTPGRSRNAAPRSPRNRPEVARNPSGDGRLRSSALSFVGGDHPDRHPPHSAPSDRRSPPRLPRDFSHGLPDGSGQGTR